MGVVILNILGVTKLFEILMHLNLFPRCFPRLCPEMVSFYTEFTVFKSFRSPPRSALEVFHTLSGKEWEFIWIVAHLAPMTTSSIVIFSWGVSSSHCMQLSRDCWSWGCTRPRPKGGQSDLSASDLTLVLVTQLFLPLDDLPFLFQQIPIVGQVSQSQFLLLVPQCLHYNKVTKVDHPWAC